MKDFKDVLAFWPSLRAVSDDTGISYETVCQWNKRNSIHPRHWSKLVAAAKKRGFKKITLESLLDLTGDDRRLVS